MLLDLGCLPQNIWAIEQDARFYRSAVDSLKSTKSFVHVHRGTLNQFFSQYGGVFDLVYIDACGALPGGRPDTLGTLLALLTEERLADIAVLVTNLHRTAHGES